MEFDVVVVGAGPAGLSAAIRIMQLAESEGRETTVCVVEKGSEVGAHILSGAVLEPRALDELLPDWKERGAPLNTPVAGDTFYFYTSDKGAIKLPGFAIPKPTHNDGNYIVSMGNVCRWLAEQAEALGVEIYPGFSAAEVLFNEEGPLRVSPPAKWAWVPMGSTKIAMFPVWSCTRLTPCLLKAVEVTSASS